MVFQTKSKARVRCAGPSAAVGAGGTGSLGMPVASSDWRPIMFNGSMSEQDGSTATVQARAMAAIPRRPRSRIVMDLPILAAGTRDGAQLRAGEVALQDGEARDGLGIRIAYEHHRIARLARERADFGVLHALALELREVAPRTVLGREHAQRDGVVGTQRDARHAALAKLRQRLLRGTPVAHRRDEHPVAADVLVAALGQP